MTDPCEAFGSRLRVWWPSCFSTGHGKQRQEHEGERQLFTPIVITLFGVPSSLACKGILLPAGEHTFPFSTATPLRMDGGASFIKPGSRRIRAPALPSSYPYDGSGSVDYSLRAYCDVAWASKPELGVHLPFFSPNPAPAVLPSPVSAAGSTVVPSFLCCGNVGAVSLKLGVPTPVLRVEPTDTSVTLHFEVGATKPAAAVRTVKLHLRHIIRTYRVGPHQTSEQSDVWARTVSISSFVPPPASGPDIFLVAAPVTLPTLAQIIVMDEWRCTPSFCTPSWTWPTWL